MLLKSTHVAIPVFATLISSAIADQTIMNMMPRWDGGYGFQVRSTYMHRSDLLLGNQIVGKGFSEWKHDFLSKVEQSAPDHGNGDTISIGFGFVW